MPDLSPISAATLREAREAEPGIRDRDLAARIGVSEAALLDAHVGHGALRIASHPDRIVPKLARFGPLMALTRNESCVIEKTGVYASYSGGAQAGFVAAGNIDLRMFPAHWTHAFALERETARGLQRSIQVFDAAGDAVHKIYLRDCSDAAAWPGLLAELRLGHGDSPTGFLPRPTVERPLGNPDRAGDLRAGWGRMTDTHQFVPLVRRLGMNRLGAYRLVGAPMARRLGTGAVGRCLEAASDGAVPIMVFVGNRGCIEIHSGPIANVVRMGPWINVLDPGFDLHLRGDHVAEVWAVEKPTRRGPAVSVECFDAEGALIAQFFGVRAAGDPAVAAWEAIVATEPAAAEPHAMSDGVGADVMMVAK